MSSLAETSGAFKPGVLAFAASIIAKKIAAAPGARETADSGADIEPTDITIVKMEVITLPKSVQLERSSNGCCSHKEDFYADDSLRAIQLRSPPEAESRSAISSH